MRSSASKSEAAGIAARVFSVIDADRDGVLQTDDIDKLVAVLDRLFGKVETEVERSREILRDVLDRDKDGVVDIGDIRELCLRVFCNFTSNERKEYSFKENRFSLLTPSKHI